MNVYYAPEEHGLEIVTELDLSESWEYCGFVVWRRRSDGKILWTSDTTCSCFSPYDQATADSLAELEDLAVLKFAVRECYRQPTALEASRFFDEVKAALKGAGR